MLFRKDMDPRCAYCQRGERISDSEVACVKHGVVPAANSCRFFRYDPLKRIPARPAVLESKGRKPEDFSL